MHQKGNNSNNIQIGNAGSGNVINVVQNQPRSDHTQLVLDEKSVREYEKATLKNDSNIGLAKFSGSGLLGALGFLSDSIGVSSYFGFSLWWLFLVGIFIGSLLAIPHLRSLQILNGLPNKKNEANFIGNNELVQESDNGKITVYHRSATCIYPNCTGTIILSPAPEREQTALGKNFVGICSLAGRDHSYRIDYIWNAFPAHFDWRPVEPNTKKL